MKTFLQSSESRFPLLSSCAALSFLAAVSWFTWYFLADVPVGGRPIEAFEAVVVITLAISLAAALIKIRHLHAMNIADGELHNSVSRYQHDALREKESKLRTLFSSMGEGLVQVDRSEVIEYVNDRLCEMTGYERFELLGKTTLEVFFDDEGKRLVKKANEDRNKGLSGKYESRLKKKSGELIPVIISGGAILNSDGDVTGSLGMFMDISDRKRAEEQLIHDAFHDPLTGLANRALFMDHLRITIERSRTRNSKFYAVLFLDFDGFKETNDSLGHAAGDKLLYEIARRLEDCTRTGDVLARFGGDEFVILLTEMLGPDDAIQVVERIGKKLKIPFELDDNDIIMSASIGVALSTDGHHNADDMIRDADIAMYRAKTAGTGGYQVFNQAMRLRATTRQALDIEMKRALENGEFELHYQPIMGLETLELSGFEALVRWRHTERGMIPPDQFIPAAEESGLILELGHWILEAGCRQMYEWQTAFTSVSPLILSVNLSSKQFLQSRLAEHVAKTLNAVGLEPACLNLEITESHLVDNTEKTANTMSSLRNLGVSLSLDDFGTGYSCLSYLHRLPINNLKIDRSFVSRMAESEENNEIVKTIIKLAQNLKMKVVAEGIETAEQLEQLSALKCAYGQGFYFSKPLTVDLATEFIEKNLEPRAEAKRQY